MVSLAMQGSDQCGCIAVLAGSAIPVDSSLAAMLGEVSLSLAWDVAIGVVWQDMSSSTVAHDACIASSSDWQ